MTLVLSLEGPAAQAAKQKSFRLDSGRVTIGRSRECDWPLPDPERTLSRQHCVVEERGGRYFLTDTSANGVYLDGAGRPVGRDNKVEIQSGSYIELGDFRIDVSIDAGLGDRASARPGPSVPAPRLIDQSRDLDDIFGEPASVRHDGARQAPTSSLLDESFVQSRPLRQAHHPVERPVEKVATPHDHTPIEFEALDLPKPKRSEPQQQATPFPEPAQQKPGRGEIDDEFLQAFLDGAGIDRRALPDPLDPETARQLGEAFAALAGGVSSLLRNRAMIKREAGIEQTMIGNTANNPLKFALNDRDAVEALVHHRGQGYLEPLAAIEEGIKDIERHELAVLDGMQAALTSILQRFDPERLEKELADRSAWGSLITGGRRAQYWELFKGRYSEIAQSARQRFMGELGDDFAQAYRRRTQKRRP